MGASLDSETRSEVSRQRRILFVCTGNVCRSPYAEYRLRALMNDDFPLLIASAGTRALEGSRPPREILTGLERYSIDASGHRARQLHPRMVERSGLILAAERAHTAVIARLAPSARQRTYTLRQFVRLAAEAAGAVDVGRMSGHSIGDWVDAANAARGRSSIGPDHDEIADPWGGSRRAYARTIDAIDESVTALSQLLQSRRA